MKRSPKLVLFDLDDTLCDYAGARKHRLATAFEIAFRDVGAPPPDRLEKLLAESIEMQPHGADHFGNLLARHGVLDPRAVSGAQEWYRSHPFEGLSLFPDAVETLLALRRSFDDLRLGLITNGPADVQRAKIELLDIDRYLDVMLISGEFGVEKPDPKIFVEALRLAGRQAHESVFVGDSPEFDIAGARRSGIRSIWMNWSERDWTVPEPRPDHEIARLSDLVTLLI